MHRQCLDHSCLRNRPQLDISHHTSPGQSPCLCRRASPPMTAVSGDCVLPGLRPAPSVRPSAEWERPTHFPALQSFLMSTLEAQSWARMPFPDPLSAGSSAACC